MAVGTMHTLCQDGFHIKITQLLDPMRSPTMAHHMSDAHGDGLALCTPFQAQPRQRLLQHRLQHDFAPQCRRDQLSL